MTPTGPPPTTTTSTSTSSPRSGSLLVSLGHRVLLHGRNPSKLEKARGELGIEGFVADLSAMPEVERAMTQEADAMAERHARGAAVLRRRATTESGDIPVPSARAP